MTAEAEGWVYLVHLEKALGNPDNPRGQARHYLGQAADVMARLAEHGTARGARMLEVARERGITWELVRTWPGGRDREREIKDRHEGPRLCPKCTLHPKPGQPGQPTRPVPTRQAPQPVPPRPRPSPAERGARTAEHFLARRPGWTADRLTQAAQAAARTYHEAGRRTPAGDAEMAAFTARITAAAEQLRHAQPEEGKPMTTTQEAHAEAPETRPATPWQKGAQTAHDLIIRQAEAGQSAEHIAGKWEGALATYDDATATGAEREWHAGAKETAADMIQTLRDMERAEAEQAQAARDAREAEPEPEAEAG